MKNSHADDMFTCGSERKCVVKTDQLWDEMCLIWDSSAKTDRTSKAVLWSHTGIGPRIAEKETSVEHTTVYELAISLSRHRLEIDRYIGWPIFFPIFKHFTIIAYRLWKKTVTDIYIYIYIYIFFKLVTYTIIQIITSSEMCSLHLTHSSAHTPGAVDTHTHTPGAVDTHTHTHTHTHLEQWTHTHTPGAVDTHTHTWSSGHTHTHTHTPGAVDTHTPGAVDTHTHTWSSGHTHTHTHTHLEQWTHTHIWSSGHCSLRRSSSTTTACNFIQDSLVWNTLNYINIYYRTIILPINISIEINYLLSPQAMAVWV